MLNIFGDVCHSFLEQAEVELSSPDRPDLSHWSVCDHQEVNALCVVSW